VGSVCVLDVLIRWSLDTRAPIARPMGMIHPRRSAGTAHRPTAAQGLWDPALGSRMVASVPLPHTILRHNTPASDVTAQLSLCFGPSRWAALAHGPRSSIRITLSTPLRIRPKPAPPPGILTSISPVSRQASLRQLSTSQCTSSSSSQTQRLQHTSSPGAHALGVRL